MAICHEPRVESDWPQAFAQALAAAPALNHAKQRGANRLNLDQEKLKNSLGQLVLTLVKLVHELLERQAIRRMEAGSLTEAEIERIGTTLMMQAQEIERLRKEFGLAEEDLNMDLGPLGRLL